MALDPVTTATFLRTAGAGSPRAKRPAQGSGGAARPPGIELKRARRLLAAAEAVRKSPFEGFSDAGRNGDAGVSRQAFDDHVEGREAALLVAFEQTLALATARASAAFQAQEGWVDRVRAGLLALLGFFDEEPALARFLVVGSAQAGPVVLERRCEMQDVLARVLDDERAPARGYPPPLTAEAVVSGVLGVLHGRLSKRDPGMLVELANPLMSFIVLPFLGVRAARRELERPPDASSAVRRGVALELLQAAGARLNRRTVSVLRVVGGEPGLSNREVALRAGVKDQGQISRLLGRLAELGLVASTRDPRRRGAPNAWQLTASGEELDRQLGRESPVPRRSVAVDLMRDAGGRLNHRSVSVLRVIAGAPGLSNSEVALRVGVAGRSHISRLLARMARLGLIENIRSGGRENVWQLTASGRQLERAIGHENPGAGR
jgi:DNA-binding MarR family transcriptional regulator